MAEAVTETWEYIGEFARGPKRSGPPPGYRAYRNGDRTRAAILRLWPDPEDEKTTVATTSAAGDLVFEFPVDETAGGEAVPWSRKDRETAELAIRTLMARPATPSSTGAARA